MSEIIEFKSCVHGFALKRNIKTNAEHHFNSKWVLNLDIKDFFPSINFGRVRGLFLKHPFNFNHDVATLLAQICTYDNELPQGSPCSPIISNLICRNLDTEFSRISLKNGCKYTRYADDITISTSKLDFPRRFGVFNLNGFTLNDKKISFGGIRSRQEVTGVIINEKLNVRKVYVKNIRAMIYMWKKFGLENAENFYLKTIDDKHRVSEKEHPRFRSILYGKMAHLGFIKGYSDKTYLTLVRKIQELDEGYNPRLFPTRASTFSFTVIGEGKTDALHINTALKYFQLNNNFLNLDLKFPKEQIKEGWEAAISYCETLSKTEGVTAKHIFVFDRDVADCIKKATDSTGKMKDWGNNIYSIVTPLPVHRSRVIEFCIEMYYPDEIIQKEDSDGRRIFLRSEFFDTGKHKTEPIYTRNKSKTLIYDSEVFNFETQKSLTITKSDFALAISERHSPYENVDFESFRPLFELILEIAQR